MKQTQLRNAENILKLGLFEMWPTFRFRKNSDVFEIYNYL